MIAEIIKPETKLVIRTIPSPVLNDFPGQKTRFIALWLFTIIKVTIKITTIIKAI